MNDWRDSKTARLVLALAGALAVNAQSLALGLFGDDFAHRRFILDHLTGQHALGAWWNMFDSRIAPSVDGPDPSTLFGRMPWWASSDFRFALLRPLSTATHYLDYLLWPNTPWAMHAHNLVWFGVVLLIAGDLYQRLLGSGVASWLALMTFAIDDAHTVGTAWIASRNTLLTAVFVLLVLWLHDRAAQPGSSVWLRRATALALLCAHASSEGAITAWSYLLAYAMFVDARPLRARLRALWPLLVVSAGWLGMSAQLGYRVRGNGIYIDPREDPLAFMGAVMQRLPALFESQLGVPGEYIALLPASMRAPAGLLARLYVVAIVVTALWLARRDATARFFAAASVLALVPQCAAGSFARLLLLSGFAAHGVIAIATCQLLQRFAEAQVLRKLAGVTLMAATLFVHGLVAVQLPGPGLGFSRAVHASVLRAAQSLPAGEALRGSTIIVLNFPDYLRSVFVGLYRNELFSPGPQRMHVLGVGPTPVRISRPSREFIELQPVGGYWLDPTTLLARRSNARCLLGHHVSLSEIELDVAETSDDGRPARIRIRSDALERAALLWVTWSEREQRFVRVVLPAVGASEWLEPAVTP